MRWLIVGTARSGSTALFSALADALDRPRLFFEEPAAQLSAALRRDPAGPVVAKVIFDNESAADILSAALGVDHKIVLLRDPRDSLVSSLLYAIASLPPQLADPAFCAQLIDLLQRKQQAPAALPLIEIARLFDDTRIGPFVADSLRKLEDFAHFEADLGEHWLRLRYEDIVAGRLPAWGRPFGLALPAEVDVPAEHARVARHRAAGDWRHWFTAADVEALRPGIDPLLRRLGYAADWTLAAPAHIGEAHSWRYVQRLIEERRRHYQLPAHPSCTVCGGSDFGPGPLGRMATSGAPPHCRRCGALERQRIIRGLFQALPPALFEGRRGLQFSPDNGVDAASFARYEVSVYGGENSLDVQAIARDSGAYDFVSLSHVIEFVPDDQRAFDELARVLSPGGMLLACFSAPLSRARCIDYAEPTGPHGCWHLYGADLAAHFRCQDKGLTTMAIEGTDPCTGTQEVVHLFLKDRADAARIAACLRTAGLGARVVQIDA
ncbi:methyltransferase domain-containing protein [Aquabacterium sp.]|uniref:methyltransferase domain-containing protein n=1 Tax=Aquabacterium sp. TaxID=1872578 RepID=UPI002C040B64|nr:methyltransferase domain-containing protein [Aquabacterium sp.]HSW07426.1 methyltransferase domain-containing protein [Aquabacterium sp.]